LVGKICMKCVYSYTLDSNEVEDLKKVVDIDKFLETKKLEEIRLYKGKGCDSCNNGFSGRIGLFEILELKDDIKDLILERADADTIREAAVANGMITIFEDGFNKVVEGKTTLEELFRVTKQ